MNITFCGFRKEIAVDSVIWFNEAISTERYIKSIFIPTIFNYCLSRARKTIENVFGILAAMFRIFKLPINATPDHVVKASVVPHNFLRVHESSVCCPPGFIDSEDGEGNVVSGEWRLANYRHKRNLVSKIYHVPKYGSGWNAAPIQEI